LEVTTQTNHLGPFLLTILLKEKLAASGNARVVNVSSLMNIFGNVDVDNVNYEKCFKPETAYSTTKLMNILFTKELSRRWKPLGITSYSLHPGFVRSAIFDVDTRNKRDLIIFLSYIVGKNTVQGAQTSIFLSMKPGIEHLTGEHFADCRLETLLVNKEVHNADLAEKLWRRSEELVKKWLDR